MTFKIHGNRTIVRSEHPHYYVQAADGDAWKLRELADSILEFGGVKLGQLRERPDDTTIEMLASQYCYNRYFTGDDQLNTPNQYIYNQGPHLALNILNWLEADKNINGGLGPTIGCASLEVAREGLLAGYGIATRRVHGATGEGGVDNAGEWFNTEIGKWIFRIAHTNSGLNFKNGGGPMSLLELAVLEISNPTRPGTGLGVDYIGRNDGTSDGTSKHTKFDPHYWIKYARGAKWATGNRTIANVDSEAGMWKWLTMFDSLPGDTVGEAETVRTKYIRDIEPTPNSLYLFTKELAPGIVMINSADDSMIDPSKLQIFEHETGVWTDTQLPRTITLKEDRNRTSFRCLGPLGNASNIVTISQSRS